MNQDKLPSPERLADPDQGWWPLALSRELGHRPLGVLVAGQPLVLFRPRPGKVAALPDACPHRQAPLSKGRVVEAALECPYHGWSFNAAGQCTRVPGSNQPCTRGALLEPWLCQEWGGAVWVSRRGDIAIAGVDAGELAQEGNNLDTTDSFWIRAEAEASMLDAAENFLEAYHTHFVHAGWIRRDRQRQPVEASLRRLADGIQVEYWGETGQNGWLSRLLEPTRGRSFGRFRWPNLAQIEYRDAQDRLSLLASTWLCPTSEGRIQVFTRITTRRGLAPAGLKHWLLRRLFQPILRQDLRILAQVSDNRRRFGEMPPPLDASHDLMGSALRQMLTTHQLDGIAEQDVVLWL